jgi:hypothetical protein
MPSQQLSKNRVVTCVRVKHDGVNVLEAKQVPKERTRDECTSHYRHADWIGCLHCNNALVWIDLNFVLPALAPRALGQQDSIQCLCEFLARWWAEVERSNQEPR